MAKQNRREKADIPLTDLINLFVLSKQIEGRSQKTLIWYRGHLDRFAEFATGDRPVALRDLTIAEARAFIAHLQGRTTRYEDHRLRPLKQGGLSPHTIHAYVRTLKVFGNWLHEEGYTGSHPFARLKTPKLPETMIEILTDEEIGRLIKAVNPNCFLGARLYAILLLLLDTGIRASELCGLTMSNTFLQDGYVKVLGKGKKERIVPIGNATKRSLLRYVQMFRPEPTEQAMDQFFLSVNSEPFSYNGLALAIRRLGQSADVPRLHAHLFRHTFAVRYLMNGGDLMTLKLILGHTTLEVTQMYLHLAEAHVQIQHNRFSPVDRLQIAGRILRK